MSLKSMIPFGRSALPGRPNVEDPFFSLRQEMDRLFEGFTRDLKLPAAFGGGGLLSPKVNIAETEAGLEVTADLPGVDPADIALDLSEGVLTIKAEHRMQKEENDEKKQYHLVERSTGSFLRRFALPFEADEDNVQAAFDKGVLTIKVPRSAKPDKQPRKIEIRNSQDSAFTPQG